MNWFSAWLKKGFYITIRRPWPGEKNLPAPGVWDKPVSKEDIRKEINQALKNKEGSKNVEPIQGDR